MRVKFIEGEQRKFLKRVIESLNCPSLKDLSQFGFDIPYSTLKNYYAEQSLMPESFFKDLCFLSKINENSLNIIYFNNHWGKAKGGKIGIQKMMKKHRNKLKIWRKEANKKSAKINSKMIIYPRLNEDLAEFIGAYLGDGTLTKYVIKISGDYRYDLPYLNYLSDLVFKLFGIKSRIERDSRKEVNTVYLIIRSKRICEFLRDKYGIRYGDKIKNKTSIPKKILNDNKLSLACLRGLIDTDGSISRRGRNGSQFCINFTSHNPKLLKEVNEIGIRFNLFTYKTKNNIGTNKWSNIMNYFCIVGSSNLRHIVRFHLKLKENKTIYRKEVIKYYQKPFYRNIILPFKIGPMV